MKSKKEMLCAAVTALFFVSCAETFTESYHIQGSSSVSLLDGSKLYLRVMTDGTMQNIDSCEVVHGAFSFTGRLDTTRMAILSVREGGIPVVIERGDINVTIDRMANKVSGTPLNELLYDYVDKHIQLENQIGELGHKEAQMILDGIDEQTIAQKLTIEHQRLLQQTDSLETRFILDNLDNVLGPYAFQMLTSTYRYPVLTPQIEEIMGKATDTFKKDPYVSQYYQQAKDILARMRGEIPNDSATLAAPQPQQP